MMLETGLLTGLLLGCVSLLVYWLLVRKFSYWSKKGVYNLEPNLLFGNIKNRILFRIAYHEFQKELYFKLKGRPFAGIYEGRLPNLMVLEPELIKSVLVRDFDHFVDRTAFLLRSSVYINKMLITLRGSEWKKVRAAISPTFTSGKIKGMLEFVTICAHNLTAHLDKVISEHGDTSTGPVDAKELLSKFTLDIIASCAFGVQCNSLKDENSEFVKEISQFNYVPLWKRFLLFAIIIIQIPPSLAKYIPLSFMNTRTVKFLANVIKETTKQRLEKNIRRNDFLQLMMDAEKVDEVDTNNGPLNLNSKNTKAIDEDVMIAQAVLFFIAGFETSSTQLSMACYELAKNREVQDKLREEINQVLAKTSGEVTYESIGEMVYLEMVMSETLRMYPPVARLDRTCVEEYSLPGGVTLEKGTRVNIPVMGLHYDPDYYPDPQKFNPLRFSTEEKASRSPYVYLPFGAGPRNCIGLRFAQMTTKVCMIHLLKNFSVDVCDKTETQFTYDKRSMLLKSKNGVWLQFSKVN